MIKVEEDDSFDINSVSQTPADWAAARIPALSSYPAAELGRSGLSSVLGRLAEPQCRLKASVVSRWRQLRTHSAKPRPFWDPGL